MILFRIIGIIWFIIIALILAQTFFDKERFELSFQGDQATYFRAALMTLLMGLIGAIV